MKKIGYIIAAACIAALCFTLVGCGGGQDNAKNFVGKYEMTSFTQNGQNMDSYIQAAKQMGAVITMEMDKDGNFVIDMINDKMEGTWKANSATECALTYQNDTIKGTLNGDTLTISEDNNSMSFKKLES